jgi:SpoVK/Ycf46/Vps4 family AAA+-type ATPase
LTYVSSFLVNCSAIFFELLIPRLKDAARRRFVKKLYIPLPEFGGRRQIIENLMRKQESTLTPDEIDNIAEITDGMISRERIIILYILSTNAGMLIKL